MEITRGTITNSRLQFTANQPLAKFLPALGASSQNYIDTACCLPNYIEHSNFAQILNSFIMKLTR